MMMNIMRKVAVRHASGQRYFQNVIDRFNLGMAIVSPDMRVSYSNALFNEHIASLLGQGELKSGNAELLSRSLQRCSAPDFIARCNSGKGEAFWVVEGKVVGFHFRPKALRQTALQRGGASGVLVLRACTDGEERPAEDVVELLQFAYGLTAKEAEVALLLADGLSPDAIAKKSEITVDTVRT